ncbi:MAG TPA: methyltransferase domain-containing protein [Xanthobacteraceae bacterium]|nr:methyltransferase domain-containing protein [Xanthobacteraceae bacterium]
MQTAERLAALMEHLGLARAHVATQVASDVAGLAAQSPHRIAGLVLCAATRLDPAPFERVAPRLLMISGDKGLAAQAIESAHTRLPAARRHVLAGYEAMAWSDVVADRAGEVAGAIVGFLAGLPADPGPMLPARSGTHAGLTYRIEGRGPPLILLPFFLAPSQWDPALPELARHFTVIRLGGAHIGGVAALEDRARAPSYRAMFRSLVDLMAPQADSRMLDVGCGSGALDRLLAQRLGPAARIDAVDVNPFLLREAAGLAAEFGARIRFAPGSATALPFPDETFDGVFSVTVLEECDAEQAIAEMIRVTRPGGRIGIVVRAVDLPQWWNLNLPPALKAKAETTPRSVGPGGVADASLYPRLRRAGLVDLVAFPALVTLDDPDGPIWRYREDHVLAQLSPEETEIWHTARVAAMEQGPLLQSHPLHCAVGRKPAGR